VINPLPLLGNMPEKIEFADMVIFEKKNPVYDSLVFGVPVKYIAIGVIAYKVLKR